MPSEMVGIWGQFILHDNIRLGNKTSLIVFSALKLFFFMFLYLIRRSRLYIALYEVTFQN